MKKCRNVLTIGKWGKQHLTNLVTEPFSCFHSFACIFFEKTKVKTCRTRFRLPEILPSKPKVQIAQEDTEKVVACLWGDLVGLATQTQNAAFFERKGPQRKPWPRGKPLNGKKQSQSTFRTLALYRTRP